MAILYIVATPIGNLEDITFRALRILKEVDLIICEDTRITKKLLDRYQIKKPLLSYHQHSKIQKVDYIISLLKEGKNLALVSDSGTPGVSDPGNKLVEKVVECLNDQVKIVPIPGPSAITCAASISGFAMDKFLFLGFLPKKKRRKEILEKIVKSEYPVIFYESPYRLLKTLRELSDLEKNLEIVVCKELTKKFEEVFRGKIEKVIEKMKENKIKGEFVIIVKNIVK